MARERDYLIPESAPRAVAEAEVESVSGLTRRIKALLESALPPCWVRGEVSNFRAQASGHFYFSLKDAQSQIGCVMFRGDAVRSGIVATLRDGAQIVVFGQLGVYEPRGNYQLIVRAMVEDGLGRLQQEFERLKQRLAAEGLFDSARKKPLPQLPRTIGFITSPTGAAVQDFIRILKRRRWRGRLVVFPAKVQGIGAAQEMMAALALAQSLRVDAAGSVFAARGGAPAGSAEAPFIELLVIGRGGGSIEDLWAFNEEPLVRAVAASAIPTIAAVGHEIDFTLCDFAADVRAETPSAAAELITSQFLDGEERCRQLLESLDAAIHDASREWRNQVELLRRRLTAVSPAARVEQGHLRLDDLANRLTAAARHALQDRRHQMLDLAARLARTSPAPVLARACERLSSLHARFVRECDVQLAVRRQQLAQLEARMQTVGPSAVLKRGYAIVRDAEGRPVTSRAAIRRDQRLTAEWHDGQAPLRAE